MKVRIISVGKTQPAGLRDIEKDYEQRCKQWLQIDWQYIQPDKSSNINDLIHNESQKILKVIHDDYVILLDERGQMISSPDLAQKLEKRLSSGKNLSIIIGGAFGVSEELRTRADFVWSLSDLVFPHQLVRIILVEQLYRAIAIRQGLPYHHV